MNSGWCAKFPVRYKKTRVCDACQAAPIVGLPVPKQNEIEAVFGEPLLWQRLDEKQASRIAYEINVGGYKDDEANWQPIQNAMIDAMVRLEQALAPFIARLRQSDSWVTIHPP